MTESPLETRYRRLLRAYPADHRESHGEEMLGVLMDGASPDQRGPGLADTADLLRAALVLRLRRSVSHYRRGAWADALALVSMLGPVTLLGVAAGYWSGVLHGLVGNDPYNLLSPLPPADIFFTPVWAACAVTGLAALRGMRRTAAAAAFGTAALLLPLSYWSALTFTENYWWWAGPAGIVILLGVISGFALLWSQGPHRARELMGRPILSAAVVLAISAVTTPDLLEFLGPEQPRIVARLPFLIGAFIAALWLLRTPAGRRACAVFAIACSPLLARKVFMVYSLRGHALMTIVVLPSLTLLGLFLGRSLVRLVKRGRATARWVDDRDQDGTPLTPA